MIPLHPATGSILVAVATAHVVSLSERLQGVLRAITEPTDYKDARELRLSAHQALMLASPPTLLG